jgi:transposase
MKVLIGIDPHKGSVAVAAVDEATGELLERASFPQNRAGLRSLERWARRFAERRWAVENACGLGVGTWREGWPRPANPWWTCRPSFRHG